MRNKRFFGVGPTLGAVCAMLCAGASVSQGAITIIKLDLGGVGPDLGMGAPAGQPAGVLSTIDQTGGPPPTGDQFTRVEYTGFLNFIPDINTSIATFSLNGLNAAGPANVFGNLVIQNFSGGVFSLYDPADNLLLQGTLFNSALTGVIGSPGTGALFTTTLVAATGGSLLPLIAPGSVSLSMDMISVNGGAGFSVGPAAAVLNSFVADGSVTIAADFIPEPGSLALVSVGAAAALGRRRRQLNG